MEEFIRKVLQFPHDNALTVEDMIVITMEELVELRTKVEIYEKLLKDELSG